MMLTDDNFASIVAAVEEGRGIFENIKKYLMYSPTSARSASWPGHRSWGSPCRSPPCRSCMANPADGRVASPALAVDPPERDIMQRPPRNPREGIFSWPVIGPHGQEGTGQQARQPGPLRLDAELGQKHQGGDDHDLCSPWCSSSSQGHNFARTAVRCSTALAEQVAEPGHHRGAPAHHRVRAGPAGALGSFSLPAVDWVIVIAMAATVVLVLEVTKKLVNRSRARA